MIIYGKELQKFEKFFDDKTYLEVYNYAYTRWKENANNFQTNFTWSETVTKDSAVILTHQLYEGEDIYEKIKETVKERIGLDKFTYMFLFYYTPGAHIPWHTDQEYKNGALTIYLNYDWDKDTGGLFLYNDGEGIKALVPEGNLGVYQPDGMWHAVSCLSRCANIRMSIQIFL